MSEHENKTAANQVWNTNIEAESNQKNNRTALALLAVTAVLVIALVVCVCLYLPKVMSFSMDLELPDVNISELMDGLFEPQREQAVPEPDYPPASRLDGVDLDFINALTVYATELCYASDLGETEAEREIHQMFLPEFQHLAAQVFDSYELNEEAKWTAVTLETLCCADLDRIESLTALYELSGIMLRVNDLYDIFGADPEVLAYYDAMQVRTAAMLEVEYDLQEQLVGTGTMWCEEYGCEAVYYTNNTGYTLDLSFANDFVTDSEHYSSAYSVGGLLPGYTEAIPLYDLEKVGSQDHTWTINWTVDEIYVDNIPLEEWYN